MYAPTVRVATSGSSCAIACTRLRRGVGGASVLTTSAPEIRPVAAHHDETEEFPYEVVYEPVQPSSPRATLKILNWSTGSTLWQRDATDPAGFALAAQPNGRDFAFADITLGGPDLKATISIVHGDGSVTKLGRSYEAAW